MTQEKLQKLHTFKFAAELRSASRNGRFAAPTSGQAKGCARKEGRLTDVILGAIPFVFVMLVMVGLLIIFPIIVLPFAPS